MSKWYIIILIIFSLYLCFSSFDLNHDVGLNLDAGRRFLHGGLPYVDYIDTNPPLITYLSAFPMLIHETFSLSIQKSFGIFITLLSLYFIIVIRFVLRHQLKIQSQKVEIITLLLVCLVALTKISYDWGQREHLFFLLYLPYFFIRLGRILGRHAPLLLIIVSGIIAGIGISIKPHFLVVEFIVELYWIIRYKRPTLLLQTEFILFSLTILAYILHFFLLPEPAKSEFLQRWLPLIRAHYSVYDEPVGMGLKYPEVWLSILGSFGLFYFLRKKRLYSNPITHSLTVYSLAAMLVFFLQHKYWLYHLIPFYIGLLFIYIIIYADSIMMLPYLKLAKRKKALQVQLGMFYLFLLIIIIQRNSWNFLIIIILFIATLAFLMIVHLGDSAFIHAFGERSSLRIRNLLALFTILLIVILWFTARQVIDPSRISVGRLLIEETDKGDAVLFIDTSVPPAYPTLLLLDRQQGSRYLVTFPIAFFNQDRVFYTEPTFPYPVREELGNEERQFLADLEEDIRKYQPKLIFIRGDGMAQACPIGFDILTYLKHVKFAEDEMRAYKPLRRVDQYVVFKRK